MIYPDSVLSRFRAAVSIHDTDDCIAWPLSKTRAGYGQISYAKADGSRTIAYAHRTSYMVANGEIPDGMLICHKCDNPQCVNPRHLFLGDYKANAKDMVSKGRHYCPSAPGAFPNHWSKTRPLRGEDGGNSKLTAEDVLYIRASAEKGVELAKRFGVTAAAISSIRKRKTWTHLSQDTSQAPAPIRENRL